MMPRVAGWSALEETNDCVAYGEMSLKLRAIELLGIAQRCWSECTWAHDAPCSEMETHGGSGSAANETTLNQRMEATLASARNKRLLFVVLHRVVARSKSEFKVFTRVNPR